MKSARSWLWFSAFVAVWCALRLFWIDSDGGVPSIWEYGYNVTDEGYYMGAAKDKLLRGRFCDLVAGESFTYGYSPLTHWLSYVGYLAFGLNGWGWRVPFYALYLVAWCMSFLYVRRRWSGAAAFSLCAFFSCLPVCVAYERTACNDLAIGALAVIAFCVASGTGVWRIFAAAAVAGAIALIKPSVWILLPAVAAGVLCGRKTGRAWLDLVLFAVAALAAVHAWRLLAVLSLLPEAKAHGIPAAEIIRRTTTHNPLPSLFDFVQLAKGFSSFPRDVCLKSLAPAAAMVTVVPLAMAARCVMRRRWDWRLLLYMSVPAYVAGVSVNNSICLHYYHPALMLLPVLFATIVQDLVDDEAWETPRPAALAAFAALAAGAVFCAYLLLFPGIAPGEMANYFSNVSNLPRRVVWGVAAGPAAAFAALMTAALAVARGRRAFVREGALWFALSFAGASVAMSGMPGLRLAGCFRQTQGEWLSPMLLSLAASAAFMGIAFGLGRGPLRRWAAVLFAPAALVLSFALVPTWRSATAELIEPGKRLQREVGAELARILPADAVVIGERSRQVLMGQPFRTATTMPGCDPIPIVERLFEENPDARLFALADTQNAYNLMHFKEHRGEFRLDMLEEFKMPSFANGRPCSVYLCRIVDTRQSKKGGRQ